MKVPFLDLSKINKPLETEISEALVATLKNGWFIGGDNVLRFEKEFKSYIATDHCISCGNGTDSLELILKGYHIGPGDEVIIPSFTWVSDAEAVVNVGARPVFADIGKDGFNISIEDVKSKISEKTKAIIAVHLFGVPADILALKDIVSGTNIKIIEDCAQAHGASINKEKVGSLGDAGSFSFYPTKNLGALGDGGAITTNDRTLAHQLIMLTNHGQSKRDQHEVVGRNSRLDAIQAAVLSTKLRYLNEWNNRRKIIAETYLEMLSNLPCVLPSFPSGSVYHLFVIKTERREKLKEYLEKNGVGTAIHYPTPIHKMKSFGDEKIFLPNTEKTSDQVLSLPCNPSMTNSEVEYVVDVLKKFTF